MRSAWLLCALAAPLLGAAREARADASPAHAPAISAAEAFDASPERDAAAAPHVVILRAGARILEDRLRAELEAAHWSAALIVAEGDTHVAHALAEQTRRAGAAAGVAATERGTVRVHLFVRATGTSSVHRFSSEPPAALAIRISELLRAQLLVRAEQAAPAPAYAGGEPAHADQGRRRAPAAEEPSPSPAKAPSALSASPAPARELRAEPGGQPTFLAAAELGAGVVSSPSGLPAFAALAISAGVFASRALRIGGFAVVPLHAMKHAGNEGESATRVTLVGGDVLGELGVRGTWRIFAALGVAATFFATQGETASALYRAESNRRTAACLYLRSGAAYPFTARLALRGELTLGVQPRPFALEYAGQEIARWGMPWLAGLLAIEARLR